MCVAILTDKYAPGQYLHVNMKQQPLGWSDKRYSKKRCYDDGVMLL